jgi:hypothetical protein
MMNDMTVADYRARRGVDVRVTEELWATLAWAKPGWRVIRLRTGEGADVDGKVDGEQPTFATIADAVDYVRRNHAGHS